MGLKCRQDILKIKRKGIQNVRGIEENLRCIIVINEIS
jgi:hypothetical protein